VGLALPKVAHKAQRGEVTHEEEKGKPTLENEAHKSRDDARSSATVTWAQEN